MNKELIKKYEENRVKIKSIKKRDELVKKLSHGKILELGCGKWPLFADSTKVDLIKYKDNIIADLNKKIPVRKKFDTIIALDVIEHLENTTLFLSECKRLLKNDGKLIISTDNAVAWFNRVNMFIMTENFSERFEKLVEWGHKKYFTPNILKRDIEKTGMKVIKMIPLGKIPFLSLCGGFLAIATK